MRKVTTNGNWAPRPLIKWHNHVPAVGSTCPAMMAGWSAVYAAAHEMAKQALRRQWIARQQPGVN